MGLQLPASHLGKALSGAVIVAAFLAIYVGVNVLHFRFFPVRVVAYAAALDVVLALAIAVPLLAVAQRVLSTTNLESSLFVVVGALLGLLYAIAVPTVIDRSLSVYILEKLQQRGGGIREDAFEELLVREFFPEHQLVKIRLTEQLNSGTVTIAEGCVMLTTRGETVARLTRLYRTTMLPRKREIMGRYSDDLTDPFRHSTQTADYRCRPDPAGR